MARTSATALSLAVSIPGLLSAPPSEGTMRSFFSAVRPTTLLAALAAVAVAAIAILAQAYGATLPAEFLLAFPAVPAVLVAKRAELDAKRAELAGVFEAAGPDLDFSKREVLEALGASTSAEAVEKVRERNAEIEALYDEAKALADVENIRNSLQGDRGLPAPQRGSSIPRTAARRASARSSWAPMH